MTLFSIKNFICITIAISWLTFVTLAVEENIACKTPLNETGSCIHFDDCEELFQLIKNNATEENQGFLRKSQCGYDGSQKNVTKQVLVCCPNDPGIKSRQTKNGETFKLGNELPEPGVCGPDFSSRIYGGNVTEIDEFPWMALIQYRKSKLYFGFHCGGALINTRYVLTAAHCVKNPDMPETWEIYAVRLGEWDMSTSPDCNIDVRDKKDCAPLHRDILIEKSIVHENYIPSSSEQYFDIALLRLGEVIEPYTDFIRPICLPIDPTIRANSFVNLDMVVCGWGTTETSTYSDKKLKAIIPAWNTTICLEKYLTYNLHVKGEHQLCAGGLRGIDACRGDSGGPLMFSQTLNKKPIFYAIGIVSYGPKPCGLNGWPGVYTRLANFIEWIQGNLEA